MSNPKSSKLNMREDRPTAIASSAHGSNVDAVGFNITFLAPRNPKLALSILELYEAAHKVKESHPIAAEEDFALFADPFNKLLSDISTDE
jgi:hypothetical protein